MMLSTVYLSCLFAITMKIGSTHAICVAGQSSQINSTGNASCECAAGNYSTLMPSGLRECQACGLHANSGAGSDTVNDCTCNAGHMGEDGGSCSMCSAGKFKPFRTPSSPSWFVTAAGNFTTVKQACIDGGGQLATINSHAENDIAAALCPGIKCYIGLVRTKATSPWVWLSRDNVVFSNWGEGEGINENWEAKTYVTKSGVWQSWQWREFENIDHVWEGLCRALCQNCAANSFSAVASTTQSACQCNAGHTGVDGGPCTACSTGKFKALAGPAECEACPMNTSSSAGSTAINDCQCDVGFMSADGETGVCIPCLSGTYKALFGPGQCLPCVTDAVSGPGSTHGSECKCGPGYTGAGGGAPAPCSDSTDLIPNPWNAQFFCSHFANLEWWDSSCSVYQICELCACSCAGGYECPAPVVATPCSVCGSGKYKSDVGSAACSACPANSLSPAGSILNTTCTCNPGYTGADGGDCTACEAGTFKALSGSGACGECPTDSSPDAGYTACVCNSGYTGTTVCTACPAGTYKTSATGCTKCKAGKYYAP